MRRIKEFAQRVYHGCARVFYMMCLLEAEERYIKYANQQAAIEYFEKKVKQHTV